MEFLTVEGSSGHDRDPLRLCLLLRGQVGLGSSPVVRGVLRTLVSVPGHRKGLVRAPVRLVLMAVPHASSRGGKPAGPGSVVSIWVGSRILRIEVVPPDLGQGRILEIRRRVGELLRVAPTLEGKGRHSSRMLRTRALTIYVMMLGAVAVLAVIHIEDEIGGRRKNGMCTPLYGAKDSVGRVKINGERRG
jgi:hypothetical protein